MPFKYASMAERIIHNTVLSRESFYNGTPCWEWIGATTTNRSGMKYGKVKTKWQRGPRKGQPRTMYAHRLAAEHLGHRVISGRKVIMHRCNNSLCCNPAHLAGGTQRTNIRQCVKDGRHVSPGVNQYTRGK